MKKNDNGAIVKLSERMLDPLQEVSMQDNVLSSSVLFFYFYRDLLHELLMHILSKHNGSFAFIQHSEIFHYVAGFSKNISNVCKSWSLGQCVVLHNSSSDSLLGLGHSLVNENTNSRCASRRVKISIFFILDQLARMILFSSPVQTFTHVESFVRSNQGWPYL